MSKSLFFTVRRIGFFVSHFLNHTIDSFAEIVLLAGFSVLNLKRLLAISWEIKFKTTIAFLKNHMKKDERYGGLVT